MVRIGHLTDAHHLTAARAVQRVVLVARAILALRTEYTDRSGRGGRPQRHAACVPVAAIATRSAPEATREEGTRGRHFSR